MNSDSLYIYRAKVIKIQDGDSIFLDCDLGFHMTARLVFRLKGIDTPELNAADEAVRARAVLAKTRVAALLADGVVTINSFKPLTTDKFGRYLAEIFNSEGANVNQILLDEGFAVPYDGGKRN